MTYIGLATSPAYEENQQSFSFREKSLWQDKLKSLAGDSDQLFYHSLIRKRDSKRRLHRCFEGTRDKCPDRHDKLGFYMCGRFRLFLAHCFLLIQSLYKSTHIHNYPSFTTSQPNTWPHATTQPCIFLLSPTQ